MTAARPLLLHISSDYPNPIRTPTTNAVERLVDRVTDCDHVVVSLQRISDPRRTYWRDLGIVNGRRLIAHGYFAPPLGIGMYGCQVRLARRIRAFLKEEKLRPNIVHSHRFTFEGIAAWMVARATAASLFFSVRGEVEKKVFATKPTYRPLFRKMARDAASVFYVSAWYKTGFERHTGIDPAKTHLLPNIVFNTRRTIATVAPEPRFLIAMTLAAIDKKGLPELLAAFSSVRSELEGISLEIIGDGPPGTRERVDALIAEHRLGDRVVARGALPHDTLLEELPTALAMVMPSHNETFGMAFVEALFAGTPILYGAETGIDGYLDGLDVGVAVTPGDEKGIARGLLRLARENDRLRRNISESAAVLYERLDADITVARYRAAIAAAMETRPA